MHVGPSNGCLPDVTGSALWELCEGGAWLLQELSPWQFRCAAQLNCAYADFSEWTAHNKCQHFAQEGFAS